MATWIFGYGSLIWKAGFHYDDRLVGFIKDYRRFFHQGSTDHRGTPEYPGRTVTLEPAKGEVCWGVAYKIIGKEHQRNALEELVAILVFGVTGLVLLKAILFVDFGKDLFSHKYLEVREKQYDKKVYLDFFTEPSASVPAVSDVLVYIGSSDKKQNKNYLGPALLEEIATQIVHAEGPSGPNREYLFQLEKALTLLGCEDKHVIDLANEVRSILEGKV